MRVRLEARSAAARIPVQVDVGFGAAVTPSPARMHDPTLLDHPAPPILACPREAEVAEKLEAIVSLGVLNRRGRLSAPPAARDVADGLRCFVGPVLTAAVKAEAFAARWLLGGPWR